MLVEPGYSVGKRRGPLCHRHRHSLQEEKKLDRSQAERLVFYLILKKIALEKKIPLELKIEKFEKIIKKTHFEEILDTSEFVNNTAILDNFYEKKRDEN